MGALERADCLKGGPTDCGVRVREKRPQKLASAGRVELSDQPCGGAAKRRDGMRGQLVNGFHVALGIDHIKTEDRTRCNVRIQIGGAGEQHLFRFGIGMPPQRLHESRAHPVLGVGGEFLNPAGTFHLPGQKGNGGEADG